jgi:hypothetical protein
VAGDAWNQRIRKQIRDCALFIPIIYSNTAARQAGYFRLEWDLADQRSHMIARNRPFIVPVALDRVPETGADVPESCQRVRWVRLPDDQATPAFVVRVRALLNATPAEAPTLRPPAMGTTAGTRQQAVSGSAAPGARSSTSAPSA